MADTPSDVDYENMSDEDLFGISSPAPLSAEEAAQMQSADLDDEDDLDGVTPVEEDTPVVEADGAETDEDEGDAGDDEDDTAFAARHTTPKQTKAEEPVAAPVTATGSAPAEVAADPVDYEASYKRIMAPFKANGRDFAPATPEEAVRLMQMGANYTKKMQALTPSLKIMRMLDNNGLLDEGKINYLIDLDRKDPGAIQKLLHDGEIDPLDIPSPEDATAYTPGNHAVSDQEMTFHDALGDLRSSPGGNETLTVIKNQWDPASKEAAFREPEIMSIINEQRANGIYDRISAEIDRRKTLGELKNTPFITAYKQVGDILHAKNMLLPSETSAAPLNNPAPQPAPRVIETRIAAPKANVTNDAAARAASSSKAAPKPPPKEFDPMNMTDEQIMAISHPPA